MAKKDEAINPEQEQQVQEPEKTEEDRYQIITRVKVQLVPGYVLRKVGQAYMVMPTGPRMKDYQGMITLNETGAFLFKEMEKPEPTAEKLMEACIAEYGATPEEAEKAVDMFIKQCAECGLFEKDQAIVDTIENKMMPFEEFKKMRAEERAKEKE